MTTCRLHNRFVLAALLCILIAPDPAWCVPPGTVISNTAQAAYRRGASATIVSFSNTVRTAIVVVRTSSTVEFLRYAPTVPGAPSVSVPVTASSAGGTAAGPFVPLSPPVQAGSGTPIDLGSPVPLIPATTYHQGEPMFLRVTDRDQNLDAVAAESVLVSLENASLGESELLRLSETGPNTGVFAGYIQSTGIAPAAKNNGIFTVGAESMSVAGYIDCRDAADTSMAKAAVDPMATSLWVAITAGKEIVAIGDFLPYSVSVRNTTTRLVSDVRVADQLPLGFRYRSGSAKIDGMASADPGISQDGRTLTFALGNLAANKTVLLRYVVELAAGARPGIAANNASASDAGGSSSNIARAVVQVKEDLSRSRCFLDGRVVADGCNSESGEKGMGVEGVRIYLEDGTYAVTDEKGMFHFEGVTPGVHVVQLDRDSLPEKYEAVSCEANTRFAGRSFSQFVDLQGGTVWRTDFHVALKSKTKGEVQLYLHGFARDGAVAHNAVLQGESVAIRGLRLSVMLPEGAAYRSGSSRLDQLSVPDPEVNGNVLTYRLGEFQGTWTRHLDFEATAGTGGANGEGATKAFLVFDTPSEKNQRTPILEYEPPSSGEPRATEKKVAVQTTGLLPGETWKSGEIKAAKDAAASDYDATWIESATPGLEWLWPGPEFIASIPSLKIAVKHGAKDIPKLLLNGGEVDPLNFEGTIVNQQQTVAVSRWAGVDLQEGDNRFEFVVTNASGEKTGHVSRVVHYSGPPVRAEVVKEQSHLVADGKQTPVIAVRLTDKDGYPAREGMIGYFTVDPPYAARKELDALQKNPLSGIDKESLQYVVGKGGVALVPLQPSSRSGEAILRVSLADDRKEEIRVWLKPEIRDWILVGLADGSMGYNATTGDVGSTRAADVAEGRYDKGRVAFFGKGKIREDWLLTMAYDNKKPEEIVGKSLQQTIDPDTYFPLYGDGAQQRYDAASARKLYLKLERDGFYALFGDYDTGLRTTELSRYSRSLNGLKSEWKTQNYNLNLFATKTNQGFIKDEIRGDGTSGLYRLSRKSIVINSEKIVLETRDRFRSEVITSMKMLARHFDYNIDYEAGTLFFREPIYSRDENLNPIFIVVDYESYDATDDAYTYGGRGAVKLMNNALEIGASLIHEGPKGAHGTLRGVDAALELSKNTRLRLEVATSERDLDGKDLRGTAYLAALTHRSGAFTGQIFAKGQSTDFGLGQQNGSETGTRKIGMDAAYRFGKRLNVQGQAYRDVNLATDATRDLGEAKVNYTASHFSARAGLRHAEDRFVDGTANRSDQITAGASHAMLDNRLLIRLDWERSLGSGKENPDFPTRTVLGADYAVTKLLTLFGEQEFTQGDYENTQSTRLGMKATPWSGGTVNTSGGTKFSEYGPRVFANLGLRQTWDFDKKWHFDVGLDHSRTVKKSDSIPFNAKVPPSSGSNENFNAVSLGASYKEQQWSWTSRVEFRRAENENKWGVTTGVFSEPVSGIGLSAGAQVFRTDAKNGSDTTDGNIRFGLAYRPDASRWILLDRLDLKLNEERSSDGTLKNWRVVNNMNANFTSNNRTQISLQYGLKYVVGTIDGDRYKGFTDLVGVEGRYDPINKWDVGFRTSVLHSWQSNQIDYSTGLSIGCNVIKNAWVSVGYNFVGFDDKDFSKANFTAQGPFVQFRMKFDQLSLRDTLQWFAGH